MIISLNLDILGCARASDSTCLFSWFRQHMAAISSPAGLLYPTQFPSKIPSQATGISTGSVYKDFALLKNGFPMESVSNGSVLVVKTHEWGGGGRKPFDAAILLIRFLIHVINLYIS